MVKVPLPSAQVKWSTAVAVNRVVSPPTNAPPTALASPVSVPDGHRGAVAVKVPWFTGPKTMWSLRVTGAYWVAPAAAGGASDRRMAPRKGRRARAVRIYVSLSPKAVGDHDPNAPGLTVREAASACGD